jgi:hypothetical protein
LGRYLCPVLIVVMLTACAATKTPVGTADFEVLPPPPYEPAPDAPRPKPRPPETPPETMEQPPPTYPDSALADGIACSAKLLYHILEDGSASLVRLEWETPPPPEHESAFVEQIRTAMLDWEFIPATKWVRKEREDGTIRLSPQAIPKAERAIVRFRVEGGHGIVE